MCLKFNILHLLLQLTLPLIEAAINGHINVVELLLFKGADPNIIDEVSISCTCTDN